MRTRETKKFENLSFNLQNYRDNNFMHLNVSNLAEMFRSHGNIVLFAELD